MYDYLETNEGSIYLKETEDNDLIEISPLKLSDQQKGQQTTASECKKKQLKLTSMQSYAVPKQKIAQNTTYLTSITNDNNKPSNQNQSSSNRDLVNKLKNNSLSDTILNKLAMEKSTAQNSIWKIKAIIDNRNFLIPLA